MSELFLVSVGQMARISPFFPLEHGVPRVDDRRVVSGIVYVIKHGLQWKDAPKGYGPHKTLSNRFIRWSRLVVFDRIFAALAAEGRSPNGLAFRQPEGARSLSIMTGHSTASVTKSRTSSPNSRTGDASRLAMTDAPTPSSRQSASLQASS